MSGLARIITMLFGLPHHRPPEPLPIESHVQQLHMGHVKRHTVKGEQQELLARLNYLGIEAETFAGFHGSDDKPDHPADLHQ